MSFLRIQNRFARLALAAVCVTAMGFSSLSAETNAVEPETTTPAAPVALPQYSSITSVNDTILSTRLPINYNGGIYYYDVTYDLSFEPVFTSGKLTGFTGTATASLVKSPYLVVNNFKAGTYVGPSNVDGGKNIIIVSGPSALSGGGTGWTLTLSPSASGSTYPSSASWYVESIASNPYYSRLKAAGITDTAYDYGIGDSGSDPNNQWPGNAILGFSQVGNTLTIASFTYNDCCSSHDVSNPVDTINYTLQQ